MFAVLFNALNLNCFIATTTCWHAAFSLRGGKMLPRSDSGLLFFNKRLVAFKGMYIFSLLSHWIYNHYF